MSQKATTLPSHIGIIMDGNGRWAKKQGLLRLAGHRQGARTVDMVVTACRKRGIKNLTLYAFSAQNWNRPSLEIRGLMELLGEYIKRERNKIMENNIRLTAVGDLARLPENPRRALLDLINESAQNSGMTLCLALSYGGQEEIVNACRAIAHKVADHTIEPDSVDLQLFNNHIWSGHLGPVDLVIRTSGELRLSNFLLWSIAYAELYFCKKYWPEFNEQDLDDALTSYAQRQRRYGELKQ